jgi:hypothetical protein
MKDEKELERLFEELEFSKMEKNQISSFLKVIIRERDMTRELLNELPIFIVNIYYFLGLLRVRR